MALRFNMAPGARTQQQQQMDLLNQMQQQESFEDLGHDIGTALAAGRQHFKANVGTLGPLKEAYQKYRKSEVPLNEKHMFFKEWKASEEGQTALDELKMSKKGGAGAHAAFMEKHPEAGNFQAEVDRLVKDEGYDEDEAELEARDILGYERGDKQPEAGAFTNWLKSDEGKGYKKEVKAKTWVGGKVDKPWADDAFTAYRDKVDAEGKPYTHLGFKKWLKSDDGIRFREDWISPKRQERRDKRRDFFQGIGKGVGKIGGAIGGAFAGAGRGAQKVGQTILPGGETGYLKHGYQAPYGGLLGRTFTPGRHAVRKAIGEGTFLSPTQQTLHAAGQLDPRGYDSVQDRLEQEFADWYKQTRGYAKSGGTAGQDAFAALSQAEQDFYRNYGGRGSSAIETVLTNRGIW
jgi:hypothetical protein